MPAKELSELVDGLFDALAEEWQWGQGNNYYPCTSVRILHDCDIEFPRII
jgi:hypothetical protein